MSSTVYKGQKISQTRKSRSMTRSLSGVFPFRGQGVSYESGLERDFIRIWSLAPEVVAIVAQPVQIPFIAHNGNRYVHTPDFFVKFDESLDLKPLLVEVKPREAWQDNWRDWLPKWKAAWRYAQSQGWVFHIFDESRIRGVRLRNVEFLQRYRNMSLDPAWTDAILKSLEMMRRSPFHVLLALHFHGHEAVGRSYLLHLIAVGKVWTDLDEEINQHSILRCHDERF